MERENFKPVLIRLAPGRSGQRFPHKDPLFPPSTYLCSDPRLPPPLILAT